MTLIKVVGIATVLYAIFRHLQGTSFGFWPSGKAKIWVLFFFAGMFTLHFSYLVVADWSVHIALFYVVMVLVDSLDVVIKTFSATIIAMLVNCIQSLKGVYLYGYYSRAAGSFGDANYFALGLIVSIGMAVCLYHLIPRLRLALAGMILVLSFTLLLTASRGGVLGLSLMVLIFLANKKGFGKKLVYALAVALITIPLAVKYAPELVTRIKGADHSTVESTENRLQTQISGLNMVKANPLTGVGYLQFKANASRYNPNFAGTAFVAHNSYLSVAAELGLPMFFCFCFLLLYSFKELRQIARKVREDAKFFAIVSALRIILAGYCCSILFLTAEREKYLWLLVFLVMAVSKLVETVKLEFPARLGSNATKEIAEGLR